MSGPSAASTEVESARKACGRLHQAYSSSRLYPSDHPTARNTLGEFVDALESHLDVYGFMMLRVEEDRLVFEDEEVYSHEEVRSSVAFLMFRDGIRFVTFYPGIEAGEIESFVDCLAHADELAAVEHDLSTALWERDLQHVEYEVVDPFLGGGGERLRDQALNELRETVIRRLSELSPGSGGAGPQGGQPEQADPESMTLTPADIRRGEQAVADPSDALEDFTVVLLEIAGISGGSPKGEEALARALALVTERILDSGDVDALDLVVSRLRSLEAQGRRLPEFARDVVGEGMTSARLTRLIASIGQVPPVEAARVERVLREMRDWVLPTLLELLAESADKAVRKTALDLLDAEGGVPARHLWPLMADPRWYVVRNAVQLATGSGAPELAGHLERLLRHPDARVRREVIRSLDAVGGARSAALLARGLSDEDPSVRTLAAHGLRRHGNRAHIAAVQVHIDSREFETRPAEEIAAFLQAYATLGGEATVEVLGKLWKRRVFGTRPLPVRLAAIQALGEVASPSAREALVDAARSGEVPLQRVAARALADIQARMRGAGG
ncbi:MAG: hypothetical protein A2133_01770 [Actinobacteria bacterium RBG_16_64_13]|nr:MAG: hypothetical protein A2133_01770 [Actinobacteria bacterium RBG_16_64_13]